MRNIDNTAFPIFSSYTEYYKSIIEFIRKNTNATLILGGSAPSLLPEDCYETFLPDYLIVGEGEEITVDLINNLSKGIKPKSNILSSNPIDLKSNVIPDRSKFDINSYLTQGGCINIQTRRGCPFKCNYCTYPISEGRHIRTRSIDSVIEEIYQLKKQSINHYFFVDNVFNYPEDYAMDLAQAIIDNKLDIEFSAYLKPYTKNQNFYSLMKKAGMQSLDFGTDAISDTMLKNWEKHFKVDDIINAHNLAKESNIKINHSLILGGPGETMDTLEETSNNMISLDPDSVICMIGVRIYKGTTLYKRLLNANEIDESDGGILPYFFLSESVEDNIIPYIEQVSTKYPYWVVPGIKKNYPINYIKRQRKKGKKGQVWEWLR
jgi:radical SAM superfamily enzyme YgiQ (UPF0313 family)